MVINVDNNKYNKFITLLLYNKYAYHIIFFLISKVSPCPKSVSMKILLHCRVNSNVFTV